MSMSGDQRHLQRAQEHIEITTQAQPAQIQQQPVQIQQPVQVQAPEAELQREQEENAALAAHVQQQLPAAHAVAAAPGAPIQEEAPAKKSWKERQREKKQAKIAKKNCPVGTVLTYQMATQMQRVEQGKERAMQRYQDLADRQNVDKRVLKAFSTPYQVDKKGRPASAEDAAAKRASDTFIEDYCSKDIQRRRPHLERMVNELLAIQFTPDMLSEHNMRQHAAQLKDFADKMVYMDNVLDDPVNKPFFDQMDPVRRERLEAGFNNIYPPFVGALTTQCDQHGVELNSGRYYGYEEMPAMEHGQVNAGPMMQQFQAAIAALQTEEHNIAARQAVRVQDSAQDYARRMREGNAALDLVKADPRAQIRPEEQTSEFLSRSVMLITPGAQHQDENVETVRTCLEVGRVGYSQRPTPALYNKAREMLAPRVQRVLDCDVEQLAQLDDEALLVRSAQLNELFMDNMFVSDLMKLQHPHQYWGGRDRTPRTLRDDLVGQREVEYSYKASMLRGLAERARGLALQRQSQAGPMQADQYLTPTEARGLADKTIEEFAAQRIGIGGRLIEAAKTKYKAQTTLGTPEFQEWLTDLLARSATQDVVYNMKFQGVIDELYGAGTPELARVIDRVKNHSYFSLAHSPEELRAMGKPQDIGEPIFRSFPPTVSMEATEKLCTPEQFRQMVLDLGAGDGMTYEDTPQQEREAAVEQNARGLAAYKRIVRAQYDMLERKYGNRLEELTIQEVCAHYGDLARDFGNIQVVLNMTNRHPDFLDPNDPADQLLLERVNYYGVIGNAALSILNFLMNGMVTNDSDARDVLTQLPFQEPECAAAAAYLKSNHPDFVRQEIDWNQKVRVSVDDVGDMAGKAVQEVGIAGATQEIADLLRDEDPEEVVAQHMLEQALEAESVNGPEAAVMAAAYAAEQALRQLRSEAPPAQP